MAPEEKRLKKPDWLKTRLTVNPDFAGVRGTLQSRRLHTVCEEARCPNQHECWALEKTATFLILGNVCTRSCRFCAVTSGLPQPPDPEEPERVARAAAEMKLAHVVVTCVTRDDLPDGGAKIFADTVSRLRALLPSATVEILTSDVQGDEPSIRILVDARPDILNHNLETVARLTPLVRSKASYERSLNFLVTAKRMNPKQTTKTGLMLGLGETREEVLETLRDFRRAGVDIVTLGQYLQPTARHLAAQKYWHPDEFSELRDRALEMGFSRCVSGPLVRSSYHAGKHVAALKKSS